MKTTFYLLTLFIFSLLTCQNKAPDLQAIETYFPAESVLKKGIVNKYYFHTKVAESHDIKTNIDYRLLQLKDNHQLIGTSYNPGFEPTNIKHFTFEGSQLILLSDLQYGRFDTITFKIDKSVFLNTKGESDSYIKSRKYSDGGERTFRWKQKEVRDTLILDKIAKIFAGDLILTTNFEGKSWLDTVNYQSIYVENIGLFSAFNEDKNGKNWTELVEQIPYDKFQKMANHGRHRIAYIDPQKTMDDVTSFKICNEDIVDYYNHDLGHFPILKGGKNAMQKILDTQLDKTKLFKESGYLTFRFVVNCEGVAGRFIREQTDLNFQKKIFNAETVEHFYGIIKDIKDWRTTMIRKEARDAYAYITFKLNDGEIIELLP